MPLAVLSPAKSLIEGDEARSPFALTKPPFGPDTAILLATCAGLSQRDLKGLMGISDALAALNHRRFQAFGVQAELAACWAFDGPAHRALDVKSLDAAGQAYAQAHIVTLSGLYGCLRPRDAIRPYRLEMGTKLTTPAAKSLYDFWGSKIAAELSGRLAALSESEGRFLVNVASEEYWRAVAPYCDAPRGAVKDDTGKGGRAKGGGGKGGVTEGNAKGGVTIGGFPVVTVHFPGPSVHAKQARGLFARFLCERKVANPAGLAAFAAWTEESPASPAVYRLLPVAAPDTAIAFGRISDRTTGKKAAVKAGGESDSKAGRTADSAEGQGRARVSAATAKGTTKGTAKGRAAGKAAKEDPEAEAAMPRKRATRGAADGAGSAKKKRA